VCSCGLGIACKSNYICCHNVDNGQGRITMPAFSSCISSCISSFFALWPLPPFDRHFVVWLAVPLSWCSEITLLSKLAAEKAILLWPCVWGFIFHFYMCFLIRILSCIRLTFWHTNKHNLPIKYTLLRAPCISHQFGFKDSWCLCGSSELMPMSDS